MNIPAVLRYLLLPASLVYSLAVIVRGLLYDIGLLQSFSFPLPVISVGNLTVGGTGKTPMTDYILSLLSPALPAAVVSRGYRRKSHGLVLATSGSTAADIGDEPWLLLRRHPSLRFAADSDRAEAVERLMRSDIQPPIEVIVLDDAMQHRRIRPGLSLLLTDFSRPIYRDLPFPAGMMREPFSARRRADIIVVTKCPATLSEEKANEIRRRLRPVKGQRIFFSTVEYDSPYNIFTREKHTLRDLSPERKVLAVAGIAQPCPFFSEIRRNIPEASTLAFPDHHSFTARELEQLAAFASGSNALILTTEKDAARLSSETLLKGEKTKEAFYAVPIITRFLFGEEKEFDKMIKDYVERNKRNS